MGWGYCRPWRGLFWGSSPPAQPAPSSAVGCTQHLHGQAGHRITGCQGTGTCLGLAGAGTVTHCRWPPHRRPPSAREWGETGEAGGRPRASSASQTSPGLLRPAAGPGGRLSREAASAARGLPHGPRPERCCLPHGLRPKRRFALQRYRRLVVPYPKS